MKPKEILQRIGTMKKANQTFNKIVTDEVDNKRGDELSPRRKNKSAKGGKR